jgi:type I restriction enzyme S subunit
MLDHLDRMDFTSKECEALALQPGDLLVCEGGDIGRTAIWNGELEDCFFQNHLHRLRKRVDDIEPSFVMYWMQAAIKLWNRYEGHGNSTTIPNLSRSRLLEFEFAKPPLPEQRAIARVLSKLQEAVEVQDRIIATLKELKAATLAKLFHEGLRGEPLKETEIGEIPESWEVVPLKEVVQLQRGFDLPSRLRKAGNVPVVSSSGVTGTHESAMVKGPGVVTGRYGTLGQVFYVEEDFWPLNTTLFVKDFKGNNPLFVSYLLQTLQMGDHNDKSAVPGVNRNSLHIIPVGKPQPDEQAEIGASLAMLEKKIRVAEAEHATAGRLFSSMLHLLMTGEVRVTPLMDKAQASKVAELPARYENGALDESVLREIVRRIVAAVSPEKIILFGSAAKGEMGPDSDVDLLVVKANVHRRKTAQALHMRLRGIPVSVDLIVATPEDLERHKDTIGLIYRSALREGKVIYAS